MTAMQRLVRQRRRITRALATVALLLVLAHVGWQLVKYWTGHDVVFGLIRLFHLDEEWNVPTLFSTLLLLSAAALLAFISVHERRRGSRDASKWIVLTIGFVYIAVDEFGHLHEQLIMPGREFLGDDAPNIFHYAWVVPAAVIVVLLAVYFLGFLRRLPARTRLGFIVAGTMFVGGAVGFEMLEGRHDVLYGERNVIYMLYVTIEESLEMAGVIVFIHVLLQYIEEHPDMLASRVHDPGIRNASTAAGVGAGAGAAATRPPGGIAGDLPHAGGPDS